MRYDYRNIVTGSAGTTLATRPAEDPCTAVLLLGSAPARSNLTLVMIAEHMTSHINVAAVPLCCGCG